MSKDVEFQDIVYTVNVSKTIISDSEKKCLLQSVSGGFKNGHLSAIMGPSGAGKSSLLNVVSGLRTAGVTGQITLNKKASCYLTQDDYHQPYLTLYELMKMACNLKLKSGTAHEPIILEILTNLNLNHRRKVYASLLSGGEKRRLSIALELVANPTIFFLDEPTSGLDEVTAAQCIRLLKNLAKQGKTVVCTIHQPSAGTFSLFDQVFVIARGQCVYQGGPNALVQFLTHVKMNCPTHYSPSDYIIELCDSEDTDIVAKMSSITQNGKLIICGAIVEQQENDKNQTELTSAAVLDSSAINESNFCNSNGDIMTTGDPTSSSSHHTDNNSICNNSVTLCLKNACTQMILEKPRTRSGALLEKMKAFSKFMQNDNAISGFHQFLVLFNLMMIKTVRNKSVLFIQLFHHCFCGIIFGLIFLGAGDEGERMFDHLKFCIGIVFFLSYTQLIVPTLAYPSEVKLVKKECFNRWYSLTPYYFAMTISRLPFQILFNMIFLFLTYYMSGLPHDTFRFGLYALIGLIVSFVAEGLGLAIGATFSITNGSVVGSLLIAPILGLAIYGFDFAADIPMFVYALMKSSFMRVGVVSMVLAVFGYDRPQMTCPDVYCHFGDPKVLLRFLRIEKVNIWNEISFLIMFAIVFRTVLFLNLRRRIMYS